MLRRAYVLLTLLVLTTLLTFVGNRTAYAVGDLSLLFDVSNSSQANLAPLNPGDFNVRFINRSRLVVTFSDANKHIFQSGGGPTFQETFGGEYFDRDSDSTYQWVRRDGSALFVDFFNDKGATNDAIEDPDHLGIDNNISGNMQELEVTLAFERIDDDDGGTFIYLDENYEWKDGVGGDTGLENESTARVSGESIRNKDSFNIALQYDTSSQNVVTTEEVGRDDLTFVICPDDNFRKGDCGSPEYIQLRPGTTPTSLSTLTTSVIADYIRSGQSSVAVRIAGGGSEAARPEPGGGEATDAACESNQGALGWILCPVLEWLGRSLDSVAGGPLTDFLVIDLDEPTGASADTVSARDVWRSFVVIANILFVVAFMVVIFGQAASIGVDTYTVKKMLPRLVVGVILIQLSYFIVTILNDITNVVGAGIGGLILAPLQGAQTFSVSITEGIDNTILGPLVGVAAAPAALLGLGALIWVALVSLPTILLVLLAVIITLVFRGGLIIMLTVLAPVALVAWVLPNTEKFFKLWGATLIKLLLMYPLIILLLASGKLFGAILIGQNVTSASDQPSGFVSLASIIANFAPYALIPFTFKFAGTAMVGISNALSKSAGRISGGKDGKGGLQSLYRRRMEEGRMRTAAGTNRLARVPFVGGVARTLARPGTGLTARSRSAAAQQFTNTVTAAEKDLQDTGITDVDTLRTMSRYGSRADLRRAIMDAQARGDNEEAVKLQGHMDTVGNRLGRAEYRAAAFKRLASYGKANTEDFAATSSYLGANPGLHRSLVKSAAITSKDAGRFDLASYEVQGGQVVVGDRRGTLLQMSQAEWSRSKPEAVEALAPYLIESLQDPTLDQNQYASLVQTYANITESSAYNDPRSKAALRDVEATISTNPRVAADVQRARQELRRRLSDDETGGTGQIT